MEDRLKQILTFNENLAFSLLELAGRFPWPVRLKVMWALARLERKGLIESKRIGFRKYYTLKKGIRPSNERTEDLVYEY